MKKLAVLVVFVMVSLTSSVAKADAGDTILLYIPNRIVDFADMFSVTLGFGPVIGLKAHVTQYCAIGGEAGFTSQIVKGINRQYGFARDNGWDASFLMISAENREVDDAIGSVKNYYYYSTGVPVMTKVPYDFHNGAKDFWSIGGKLSALVQVRGEIHPVEVADFILGLFFIDIKGDDFTSDDIDM
jgi:hypothetical protein